MKNYLLPQVKTLLRISEITASTWTIGEWGLGVREREVRERERGRERGR